MLFLVDDIELNAETMVVVQGNFVERKRKGKQHFYCMYCLITALRRITLPKCDIPDT